MSVGFKDAATQLCRADHTVLSTVATDYANTKAVRNVHRDQLASVLHMAVEGVAPSQVVTKAPAINFSALHTVEVRDVRIKVAPSQL